MLKKVKQKGYLLIEVSIAIFMFSILIFILSIFLKRVLIIEKVKANSQLQDERVFNSLNKIIEDVKNRDRNIFLNNGEQKDIFISENEVVFKKDNLFYKFEIKNNKLFISDGEKLGKMGANINIGEYSDIKFQKIDDVFIIKLKFNDVENVKIVNLR
ncbi:MAG: type II secretion system protein [Leptotrichiaceae bacterium]|nr:type II secretion system protein [Leptotrichiaceae bacterium]MBP7725166.1 type II secretion system protein [Leptotrichiaceae bacterium]MBP9629151.1 type II secretion system protein [Leptotrichiaceae bacterium]